MVVQIRAEREEGKRAKYQYALLTAQAIYYELQELGISPLPSSRTIQRWLKRAGGISERKPQKAPNPTYPVLPRQAVNDVQELDFKGPFYLQDLSHKYYLVALRDKFRLGERYKWHSVLAVVDAANKRLDVNCQGKHIRSFVYCG